MTENRMKEGIIRDSAGIIVSVEWCNDFGKGFSCLNMFCQGCCETFPDVALECHKLTYAKKMVNRLNKVTKTILDGNNYRKKII